MAFDYQTALDRTANIFALNDARRLALAAQDVQRSEQLLDIDAQRAFTRELQADIGKRQLANVRELEKLREQQDIAREKRSESAEKRRIERLDRDVIEKELTDLGATFASDTPTGDLRKFLGSIKSQLIQTRRTNLESSFQGLTNQRKVLEADIDRLAGQLSASPVSEQKQRAIALRLSSDKKLDLTDDQRNRLQIYGTGQGAQRSPRGATIQPLSPNELLGALSQSDRNEVAARIAEELTTGADPKRDAEILGIASQIQSRQNELKRLDDTRDILLKADPTLLRFESIEPQGPPMSLAPKGPPQVNASRGSFGDFVNKVPPPPAVQPVATPTAAAPFTGPPLPQGVFTPSVPAPTQTAQIQSPGVPLLAPTVSLGPFGVPQVGLGTNEVMRISPGRFGLPQFTLPPRAPASAPLPFQIPSPFQVPAFQGITPAPVPNQGAPTQDEILQVEQLARRTRGYSDAEVARKVELMRTGDVPTLREFFDYLNQVRNMNRSRGLQTPVLQTPTGSSTNVFAPVGP